MPSRIALIWALGTSAVIVAAGAAAIYWTHPDFLQPDSSPAVVAKHAPEAPAPTVAPAVEPVATPAPSVAAAQPAPAAAAPEPSVGPAAPPVASSQPAVPPAAPSAPRRSRRPPGRPSTS